MSPFERVSEVAGGKKGSYLRVSWQLFPTVPNSPTGALGKAPGVIPHDMYVGGLELLAFLSFRVLGLNELQVGTFMF